MVVSVAYLINNVVHKKEALGVDTILLIVVLFYVVLHGCLTCFVQCSQFL